MDLSGNTILITGGGSGIGRGLAEAFHAAGSTVVIAGRRQDALDAVTAANPGMASIALDVGSGQSIADVAARLVADHPALDMVISNAGVMKAEDIAGAGLDPALVEETIGINLLGTIRLVGALLPHLRTRPRAAVVTVTSGLAFVPLVATPTYCATKAALHSWSESLRTQLAGTAVSVHELAPPAVATDLMPGHAENPHSMPLADYVAEVMGLFAQSPTPDEICVERVRMFREAEKSGRYEQVFAMLNQH